MPAEIVLYIHMLERKWDNEKTNTNMQLSECHEQTGSIISSMIYANYYIMHLVLLLLTHTNYDNVSQTSTSHDLLLSL